MTLGTTDSALLSAGCINEHTRLIAHSFSTQGEHQASCCPLTAAPPSLTLVAGIYSVNLLHGIGNITQSHTEDDVSTAGAHAGWKGRFWQCPRCLYIATSRQETSAVLCHALTGTYSQCCRRIIFSMKLSKTAPLHLFSHL